MKAIGFVTGACVAALGLVGWNAVTNVTDDARLEKMLTACVVYATTGATPFGGDGRNVGVYDAPLFEGDYVADTHRILDDGRFEAAWETVADDIDPIRLCRVTARFDGADQLAFALADENFIPQITALLSPHGDLRPETDDITDGPRTLGWYENGKAQSDGLRVVLIASRGMVSSFLVAASIDG